MKHIVILSAFLSPFRSGAEACVEEVPPLLMQRFRFTIVTARLRLDLPKNDMINGIPVIRVGFGFSFDKWLFPFLAPFAAKKLKPDIVHAVLESFAGLALIFCVWMMPKAKRVLTCQSTNTSLLVREMHRCADRVTAISSVLMERAKKFKRQDAVLIPNGIHYEAIRLACETFPQYPARILFVGRLEPMKGVDTLLAALSILKEDGTHFHLRIVGDGSQRENLEVITQSLGLSDDVTFVGSKKHAEVFAEYAQASIFCGLSRSEALGNVFLEAQAAGCAVLATNVGGIPDVVKDSVAGYLIAPDDAQTARNALGVLLKHDALREQMGEAGIENAKTYDWPAIAEKYEEVYQGL